MKKNPALIAVLLITFIFAGCATSYKIKPLPLKPPSAFPNMVTVAGSQIAARAFVDPNETKEAFGFDILGAGMLPIEVVFDNLGTHPIEIVSNQTFLEDSKGNLWPILSNKIAYERATKYAETKKIFKEGAYTGFLGAAAGTLIGGAIGIVSGSNVGEAAGKGAALGAAAGATLGGTKAYASDDARREIIADLRAKSLQNKPVEPKDLAYGFLFFPGEAKTAKNLRLQIRETDTGNVHVLNMNF
jgi:hypothetical protein